MKFMFSIVLNYSNLLNQKAMEKLIAVKFKILIVPISYLYS